MEGNEMNETSYKKKLLLIPSAYNSRAMGDIEHFIEYYKESFDVYVISDKYEDKIIEEDGVKYVSKKDSLASYLRYVADYIIDAGSVKGLTKLSKSQKRISVWHGIPYKNMFTKLDPKYCRAALEYCYGMDLMISPSKFYSEKFLRESMLYDGEILETAMSRTDSLFISEESKNKIKEELNIPLDKKILLYAPTFREEGKFKLPFSVRKLKKSLPGNDWVIVTKLHYLNDLDNKSGIIDCTSYSSINNLLAISDFLITDYSSLFFDYSVLNKSIVFYQYDKEEYESDRGFMFQLEDYVDEKYFAHTEDELYSILKNANDITDNLSRVREEFYPMQKENATADLVKQLNLDSTPRKTKEIIFLVNELNQIGGVHNFVLNLAKVFKEKYDSKIIVIAKNEFPDTNEKVYFFDEENLIDIKLTKQSHPKMVKHLLRNTDGYVIGCQFGAFMSMQNHLKDTKSVLMFHGDTKDVVEKTLYHSHLDTVNEYLIKNYDKFLLLTEANKDILYENVNDDIKPKLGYMENGYDFSDRKDFYSKNGEFVAVTRLDNDKNAGDIIKIFAHEKLNPDFKVHVYGDGSLKSEFEDQIKELGLEDRIILHGYCSDKEEMYNDKQGLIMTSLTEGLPYVILEAYKYGIPIYTYDSFTSVKDMVNDKIGGVIPVHDIDSYVEALNNGLEVKNSDFDTFISRFSNEEIIKKWIRLFDELDNEENSNSITPVVKPKKVSPYRKVNRKVKKVRNKRVKKLKKNLLESTEKSDSDKYIKLVNSKYHIRQFSNSKKAQPLVSVVVPFYNNLATIENALKSVVESGYSNYEILVINDGSEENPEKICKKYKNVRYFYKENEGLGLTRNFGIENAKGKYVFFLDSDDEICRYALNHLVDYAEAKDLDVVSGIIRRIFYNTKNTVYWYRNLYKKHRITTKRDRFKILDDTSPCNKLYNLKALKESGILFEKGLYEDILFMGQIYDSFDRIGLIPNIVYTWYVYGMNTSISTTQTIENYMERMDKLERVYNNISSPVDRVYYIKHFTDHHLLIYMHYFNKYSEDERRKIFERVREVYQNNKEYIYSDLVYRPFKRTLLKIVLDNDYEEFSKIATMISEAFLEELKELTNN